ncbi:hypothetical protein [Hymenobacter sedentarius]|uniref:hypothetical protein n=1 Tax=Hymenobacter sedentarius TaxID=1411621 RepID=UPI0012FD687D|nr:hypothetical protein [Hymenobacter sedentarius]
MLHFLCLLLLLSGPLCGQTLPDSSRVGGMPPLYTLPQLTAADTVKALHRMFTNRRVGGGLLVVLGGIAVVATPLVYVATAGPSTSTYGNLPDAVSGMQLGFVLAAPITALGIYQLSRNFKDREAEVIINYTEKHILPPKIKRKLSPNLFLPPNSPSNFH